MNDPIIDQILDAAYKLLKQHGLRRTSMADIVRESGVSKATLFRRFKSREELLRNLMEREITGFINDLEKQLEDKSDPGDRLVETFVYFCQAASNHIVIKRLIETDPETVLPMLTVDAEKLLAFGNEFIVAELRRIVNAGYKLASTPEICAELITRLSHSYLLTPASVVPIDATDTLRSIFRNTLVRLILPE